MKFSYLLSFFFLLGLNVQLKAQRSIDSVSLGYNKFLVEGAHWHIDKSFCDPNGSCDPGGGPISTDTYHEFYKLEGDTVLDSVTYKKMYRSYWVQCNLNGLDPHYCVNEGRPYYYEPYRLFAFLTEDTTARKVFWLPVEKPQCYDTVFLNFSWSLPDTEILVYHENFDFTFHGLQCNTNRYSIDSIFNSTFLNYNRKTWSFKDISYNFWGYQGGTVQLYEGIGYMYGFEIEYYDGDSFGVQGSWLRSYCVGPDSACESNYVNVSIPEIPSDNLNVILHPNPANNLVSIESFGVHINHIEILDINGQNVLSSTATELNVSSLAPSIYFVILYTNAGVVRKRLVKE